MRLRLAVCLVVTACGRINFEPLGGNDGDGGTGTGDANRGDGGGGSGSGNLCPLSSAGSCPQTAGTLSTFGTHMSSANTAGKGDAVQGSCGGANAEEQTTELIVMQTATYKFTTRDSTFDTVLYIFDGSGCSGTELACNDNKSATDLTSELSLSLTAGQHVTVVVDGAHGLCGNYTLRAGLNP